MKVQRSGVTNVLVLDFIINTLLTIIELLAGSLSGSVALVSDGLQNLTDSIMLSIAYSSNKLAASRKFPRIRKSNAESVAGKMNAAVLISLAIYIVVSAVNKLHKPGETNNLLIIVVGALSVFVNFYAASLLRSRRATPSIHTSYIGLLYSGISGAGVLASGVASSIWHLTGIDAITGLAIGLSLLLRSGKMMHDLLRR